MIYESDFAMFCTQENIQFSEAITQLLYLLCELWGQISDGLMVQKQETLKSICLVTRVRY